MVQGSPNTATAFTLQEWVFDSRLAHARWTEQLLVFNASLGFCGRIDLR
jgi:hypothetical protein